MKVSKLVKDYIEKEVCTIINEKYGNPRTKYNKLYDEKRQARKKFEQEMKEYLLSVCKTRGIELQSDRLGDGVSLSFYFKMEDGDKELETLKAQIKTAEKEIDETFNNILIKLELGGTKSDLDKMLQELRG